MKHLIFIIATCAALSGCTYNVPPATRHWVLTTGPRYIEAVRAAEARGEMPPDLAQVYVDETVAVMRLTEEASK